MFLGILAFGFVFFLTFGVINFSEWRCLYVHFEFTWDRVELFRHLCQIWEFFCLPKNGACRNPSCSVIWVNFSAVKTWLEICVLIKYCVWISGFCSGDGFVTVVWVFNELGVRFDLGFLQNQFGDLGLALEPCFDLRFAQICVWSSWFGSLERVGLLQLEGSINWVFSWWGLVIYWLFGCAPDRDLSSRLKDFHYCSYGRSLTWRLLVFYVDI